MFTPSLPAPAATPLPGFSSIVAFISDGRRAALSQWFADPAMQKLADLQFAATTEDLRHAAASGSLVLIEGSRLGEIAASRIREEPALSSAPSPVAPGHAIAAALATLPGPTRIAVQQVLANPRVWSVKRLAHAAGVSTRQLVRQFRAAGFTLPPKGILLAARLAAAQGLLRRQQLTAGDLARSCGWVDTRSLRAALRSAGLPSAAALGALANGHATVSDIADRLSAART